MRQSSWYSYGSTTMTGKPVKADWQTNILQCVLSDLKTPNNNNWQPRWNRKNQQNYKSAPFTTSGDRHQQRYKYLHLTFIFIYPTLWQEDVGQLRIPPPWEPSYNNCKYLSTPKTDLNSRWPQQCKWTGPRLTNGHIDNADVLGVDNIYM